MTTGPAAPSPLADPRRAGRFVVLLLAAAVALTYANGLRLGFYFDDWHTIEQNPHIRRLGNVPRAFVDVGVSSVVHENRTLRPLLFATFALNYRLSGADPWSYHLVNIVLHWLAALLVFRIARDHFWLGSDAPLIAAIAALVVAVHPLNTSAVHHVSARSAILTAVLYLAAFDAALRDRRLVSLAFFALALLTKPIAATLPLAVLGYWLVAPTPAAAGRRPRWGFLAALSAVAGAGLLYCKLLIPAPVLAATHAADMTAGRYAMTGWSAYLYYLRLFLWPNALVIDRVDYPVVSSLWQLQAWGSLAALIMIAATAWRVRRRSPALTMAAVWYGCTLAAESMVFPLAEPVNEHRPYLAMLGLGTAAAIGICRVGGAAAGRLKAPAPWMATVVATLVVTALGAATIGRNRTWRDDYTLWLDATRKAPRNTRAWGNAGHAALAVGRYDEARRLLTESRRLAPCYAYTLMNLSVLEWRTGNLERSLRWAEQAVRCSPDMALAHYYRAAALERVNRPSDALGAYRRVTEIDPQHTDGWFAQGRLLEARGDWTAAAAAYDRVLAVDPLRTDAAMAAGVIYHHRLADPVRALERYAAALEVTPRHYGALYQRAVALLAVGRTDEAMAAWHRFVPLAEAADDHATIEAAPEILRRAAAAQPGERPPRT
jgi:tetratricopeptide (TPR) repeat protein